MECDPSSPGVPPIAALCKDVKHPIEFSKRLKNVYKYEVLGGQHTSQARAELHQEQPDNPLFTNILAEVYVGLSDDEALRLASRHNVNGHYIHKMTHRDYVSNLHSMQYSNHNHRLLCMLSCDAKGGSLPGKIILDGTSGWPAINR